jgi:uncharacterized protein (TIGR02284 family)
MSDSGESAALIADLNDLLKLDRDAVDAYSVAIDGLDNDSFRETIRLFRTDHERHIAELTSLIKAAGGAPSDSGRLSIGIFKSTLQQVGRLGGDIGVLFAFDVNERQARDKYWRSADSLYPPAVRNVVRRAAEEEDRHCTWVAETLKRLGASTSSLPEVVQQVLAGVPGLTGNLPESVEHSLDERTDRRGR